VSQPAAHLSVNTLKALKSCNIFVKFDFSLPRTYTGIALEKFHLNKIKSVGGVDGSKGNSNSCSSGGMVVVVIVNMGK